MLHGEGGELFELGFAGVAQLGAGRDGVDLPPGHGRDHRKTVLRNAANSPSSGRMLLPQTSANSAAHAPGQI